MIGRRGLVPWLVFGVCLPAWSVPTYTEEFKSGPLCTDKSLINYQRDTEDKIESLQKLLDEMKSRELPPLPDENLMLAHDLELMLKDIRGELPLD